MPIISYDRKQTLLDFFKAQGAVIQSSAGAVLGRGFPRSILRQLHIEKSELNKLVDEGKLQVTTIQGKKQVHKVYYIEEQPQAT